MIKVDLWRPSIRHPLGQQAPVYAVQAGQYRRPSPWRHVDTRGRISRAWRQCLQRLIASCLDHNALELNTKVVGWIVTKAICYYCIYIELACRPQNRAQTGYTTEHSGRRPNVFVHGAGQFLNSTCISMIRTNQSNEGIIYRQNSLTVS